MASLLQRIGIGAVAAGLLGCHAASHQIVPVEGTVVFADGKPVPKGTRVVLNPSEGRTGTASGTTDDRGAFTLTHVNGSAGAEVGKYSVQLLGPAEGGAAFYKKVPRDVADGAVLSAEVKEGMAPLQLTIRPRK